MRRIFDTTSGIAPFGARNRPAKSPVPLEATIADSTLPTGAATEDTLTSVSESLDSGIDISDRPSRELGRVSAEALERIAQALREDVDRLAPFLRSIPADPAREGGVLAQLLALLNIGIVVRDATVSAALAPLASDASVSVQSAQQRIGNLLEAQTLAVIAGSAGFVPLETPLFLVGA